MYVIIEQKMFIEKKNKSSEMVTPKKIITFPKKKEIPPNIAHLNITTFYQVFNLSTKIIMYI